VRRGFVAAGTAAAFAVVLTSACSLIVDTGGLDTEDAAAEAGPDVTVETGGGDAGTDATDAADAAVEAEGGACPAGRGPTMVLLPYGYCIDSTEVTVGQYKAFLADIAGGYVPPTPDRCSWNTTYATNAAAYCTNMADDLPESCENWCQAYAFCQWAGKHLCGAVDGGAVPFTSAYDNTVSAWEKACTGNGSRIYNFGSAYMPYCNMPPPGNDGGGPDPLPVGSEAQCEGPTGVFDLIGNASEWIDSCEGDAGSGGADHCHHVGGASSSYKTCSMDDWDARNFQYQDGYPLGFRCCSP
jgi:sulfatase modifying factor 1